MSARSIHHDLVFHGNSQDFPERGFFSLIKVAINVAQIEILKVGVQRGYSADLRGLWEALTKGWSVASGLGSLTRKGCAWPVHDSLLSDGMKGLILSNSVS